jgi:hypothetical protein
MQQVRLIGNQLALRGCALPRLFSRFVSLVRGLECGDRAMMACGAADMWVIAYQLAAGALHLQSAGIP